MGSYASIGHKLVIIVGILVSSYVSINAQKVSYALRDVASDGSFHDGVAVFRSNGVYGAINTNGKVVIKPQFKRLSDFANGTAIASTETGQGIINRNGDFILEPKYEIINYDFEHPDVYIISKTGDDSKKGLFYNGRYILPIECSDISTSLFPFVTYTIGGVKKSINTLTGEKFDECFLVGGIICCQNDESYYPFHSKYYFTTKGEPIDKKKHSVSSKGIVPFKDQESNMYGFKNTSTGQIIIKPQYLLFLNDIWVNDFIMAPKTKGNGYDLISSEGKVILSGADTYILNEKYIEGIDYTNGMWHLYDRNGNELTKLKSGMVVVNMGHENWFRLETDGKEHIYDAGHNKSYFVKNANYRDGVIEYEIDEGVFCINAETGKQIAGPLKFCWGFHEGLAVVQRKDANYREVIDRNGKIVLKESENFEFQETHFSEGVLSVEENDTYSYIYNPLGHNGYDYNQTSYSDRTIAQWNRLGHEAFEKKQYATAKDYYYRVMMNDPTDVGAVINYGAALGNLGYYDEAIESCRIALDIDPDNQLAKDNLRINLENKQIEEERLQAEEEAKEERRAARTRKSSTFWDALGNFANILSSVAGGVSAYQPYSSFSMDMDYSSSSSMNSHDYQSEYNRWARLAERHYNSLTNLGYRAKHKDGSRSGGTLSSMSGGNYVQMKKSLRDAQHEMQRIRRKAAQNGVTITPSTWETATVGY